MDFTPLFQEIMKAGPWALVCLLLVAFVWKGLSAAWNMFHPVVTNIVEAHLTYLKSVADGQEKIHEVLDNQTGALVKNNEILSRLDARIQEHHENNLTALKRNGELIVEVHRSLNHKQQQGG